MAWSESFLANRRKDWISKIGKAQYYASGTWYDGNITLKEVQGVNAVIRFATDDNKALTITEIRLIDTGGNLAFSEKRTIEKSEDQGALIQISAPIIEA